MSTMSVQVHSLVFADAPDQNQIPGPTSGVFEFLHTKNTYDDWKLMPSKKPSFPLPPVKTNFIDILGANGKIDANKVPAGEVKYDTREDSIEFYISEYPIINGTRVTFEGLKREIANFLHGKRKAVYLESDPAVVYFGFWTIDDMHTAEHFSMITLKYVLDPYGIWVDPTGHSENRNTF